MSSDAVLDRIRSIAERVAASEGLEVVDVELRGKGPRRLLRVFVDKPEGITHNDCETISRQVGAILDVEDVVPGSYTLEISSPGVERRLRRPEDFTRFAGNKVRLILREPQDGHKQVSGRLEGIEDRVVTVSPEGGRPVAVALDNIDRANLVFEWKS